MYGTPHGQKPNEPGSWKKRAAEIWLLLKATVAEWTKDRAARLSAALAFYTILSLAPLMVIAVYVVGIVLGEQAAKGQISGQLATFMGQQAADTVQSILAQAKGTSSGIAGTIMGAVVLIFGASGVLGELQASMNVIWDVAPRPDRGIKGLIRDRFFSASLSLAVAFLLLVSLLVSAALAGIGKYLQSWMQIAWLLHVANFIITLGVTTLLFALMFKYIPDAKVAWRPVWVGALVTAVLFNVGKFLLGWYMGRSGTASSYGAAGSLVATIVWVYYSAQLWFFGAEFTQVYARRSGQQIEPAENAISASEAARIESNKARAA